MKYSGVDMPGGSAAAPSEYTGIAALRSSGQRSNRRAVRRAGACAAIGVILMFLAGGAGSPPGQPGSVYRAGPVALAAVRSSHAGYVHTGYVHTGQGETHVTHVTHVHAAGTHHVVHHVYHRANVHNVHVVVHPVYVAAGYPTAGPWYPYYPYQGPYVTYATQYYPYVYYPYYADLTAQGYQDGLHRGHDDAEDNRYYDPYRKGFKYPGSVTYSNGFLQGYAVGYSH